MDYRDLFLLALKRDPGRLLSRAPFYWKGNHLRVGIGEGNGAATSEGVPGYIALSRPEWNWPEDSLLGFHWDGETLRNRVGFIHCYHFLEHLSGSDVPRFLAEVAEVLVDGGIFQYGMPLAGTELSFHDLDHKSFWTESSMQVLLGSPYYETAGAALPFVIGAQAIIGVVERNLMVVGQLIRKEREQ